MNQLRNNISSSHGMTLVELMVAIAITFILMGLSMGIFNSQYKSYLVRQDSNAMQETIPITISNLKTDLMTAGWSVDPSMAFYIEDGKGPDGTDVIYINDITIYTSTEEEDLLKFADGGLEVKDGKLGFTKAKKNIGAIEIKSSDKGIKKKNIEVIKFNIKSKNKEFEFKEGNFIITDNIDNTTGEKVTSVTGTDKNNKKVTLNEDIVASFLAPVVKYEIGKEDRGDGTYRFTLNRASSDNGSYESEPLTEGIVDMQVIYWDVNGIAYGEKDCSGSGKGTAGLCQMNPFDPSDIERICLMIVVRSSGNRDSSLAHNSRYCRPEAAVDNTTISNKSGATVGSDECGYRYRTYSVFVRPRNAG